MSKYRGTADLEAMLDAWYEDESDTREEPGITYDPDYPSIALYIDIQDERGEWVQIDNDLWKDEVREWHDSNSVVRTLEGMWRQ